LERRAVKNAKGNTRPAGEAFKVLIEAHMEYLFFRAHRIIISLAKTHNMTTETLAESVVALLRPITAQAGPAGRYIIESYRDPHYPEITNSSVSFAELFMTSATCGWLKFDTKKWSMKAN
jgi:hypothetical protein